MRLRTLGDRLLWAREQADLSQGTLAEMCGWNRKTGQTRISHYETGRTPDGPDIESLKLLSDALRKRGVRIATPGWLQFGEGGGVKVGGNAKVASARGSHARLVPLLSWVQAGGFKDVPDELPPSETDEWYPFFGGGGTVGAFRVDGDSMAAPYGKSYPHGSIIFVNFDARTPTNGQRVVAKRLGEQRATFKVFVDEGERKWLRPLNPQYPPINDPFQVIGTVVGKYEDE